MTVSREQVVRRLLEDGYKFQDQRPRVMMYRKPGRQTRVMVPRLPSMLNPSPLPAAWVNALNGWGINVTTGDTIATAFDKLRAKWPKAAAQWRKG